MRHESVKGFNFKQGLSIYNNISSCNNNIKTSCSYNLSSSKSEQLAKCKKVMEDFKAKVEVGFLVFGRRIKIRLR